MLFMPIAKWIFVKVTPIYTSTALYRGDCHPTHANIEYLHLKISDNFSPISIIPLNAFFDYLYVEKLINGHFIYY